MAALIKELYNDYSINRLSVEEKSDLAQAIEKAYKKYFINNVDIRILDMYLQGYSVTEICINMRISETYISDRLTSIFIILEMLSGYTDENFLYRMSMKYSPARINKLRDFLRMYERNHNAGITKDSTG